MLRGLGVLVGVERVVEGGPRRDLAIAVEIALEEGTQPHARHGRLLGDDDDLDAVARGDQHRLLDDLAIAELGEHGSDLAHRKALAQRQGRGAVVHAEEQQIHGSSPTPSTATDKNAKPTTALAAQSRAPLWETKRPTTSAA